MKRNAILFSILLTCCVSLLAVAPALAFPPLPSSFYGTVKAKGANVPDGTLVRALVNGQAFAQARTQTYQGDSVYSLDVMGDDSSTTALEGGREGNKIQYEVGGAMAEQTGLWHSGTNVQLNLTVSALPASAGKAPTPAQTSAKSAPICPGLGMVVAMAVATGIPWRLRRRRLSRADSRSKAKYS